MDELIRSKMHEALDVELPAGDLRSRVIASLPVGERSNRTFRVPSFQGAAGVVAALLTVALVAALLYAHGLQRLSDAGSPGQRSNLSQPWANISMMSATSGWADLNLSGHPKHTTDGGAHWTDVSPPSAFAGGNRGSYFYDANRAWVAEAAWGTPIRVVSQRTIDGGRTWENGAVVTLDDGSAATAGSSAPGGLSLYFLDPNHGWLFVDSILNGQPGVGEAHRDALYRTDDAGLQWTLTSTNEWSFAPAPFTIGCPWGAPVFTSLTNGFMYGPDRTYEPGRTINCAVPAGPSLHVTHDGGVTWQFELLPEQLLPAQLGPGPDVLEVPSFVDQLDWFLAVNNTELLATTDGGNSWQVRSMPGNPTDYSNISWLDARNGFAWTFAQADGVPLPATIPLYRTTDGGATWARVQTNLQFQTSDGQINFLEFIDHNTGFAARLTETTGYKLLLKTADGGRTWTEVGSLT